MKTTTISVRVPMDFKECIQAICESKGITISDYCISKINPSASVPPINAVALQKLEQGGIAKQTEAFEIPNELHQFLGITGGLGIGIIVYKALKDSLQENNPEWTEEKCTAIAVVSGVASAFIGGYGISNNAAITQGASKEQIKALQDQMADVKKTQDRIEDKIDKLIMREVK